MNVDRCIELHNRILEHGWTGWGRSSGRFQDECLTWFAAFPDEAEAVRPALAPEVFRFLQHARTIWEPASDLSAFYWVKNLSSPEFMFEFEESFLSQQNGIGLGENEDAQNRYIVLYIMNTHGSHRLGLVYDQKTHLSIISPTIWEMDCIFNSRKSWYPLETVLEFWLGQISKGQIVAVAQGGAQYDAEYKSIQHFNPWMFVPYNETMLAANIEAFNQLVQAIETRLPASRTVEAVPPEYGLIEESLLESIQLPQGFAYEFLRRARRPRFQMIAPGLEIPTFATVAAQPFGEYLTENAEKTIPPLLLFRSKLSDVEAWNGSTSEDTVPFFQPFKRVLEYPSGFYLLPTSSTTSEDQSIFVLPFGIGANGFARKSDGSLFGAGLGDRNMVAKNSFIDLYRPGHCPFEEGHEQSMRNILVNWLGKVERGDWKIDHSGVTGGIHAWKEVDTLEGWEKYVIPQLS